MTTVRTPPPPPLPVRQRAVAPAAGLSPMLSRLAAERATGVLVRECGSLYLSEGQVVHAESPATPGLDVLLTVRGALNAEGWREAIAEAGARRLVGRFLVDRGRIAKGALELCHLGALYDAAYFVLGPSSAPSRFRYGAAHWLGPVHPVPVAAVERETLRRRELLHRIWSDPATDDAPLVRIERLDEPAVAPRQAAVLGRVDGTRTAADISRALGRPAFHTLVDLRRLAAAGIVAPAPGTEVAARHEERERFDAAIPAEARAALRATSPAGAPPGPAPVTPAAMTPAPDTPAPATPATPVTPVGTATARTTPTAPPAAPPAPTALPARETPPLTLAPPDPLAPPDIPAPPDPLAHLALTSTDPDVSLLRRLRDALEAL
ncbi:hypothetical protein ABZU45_11145 [Streptomyces avermitilis]|uniref:hypothetical protein n=1 Tax=Streptomyces avermitilis TaxID=33903 RepID=UPI0033ACA233